MEKVFITNRNGEKIALTLKIRENQKGIGFVMHGLGGSKEAPHIQMFAKALEDNGYTTINFDTTRSFGESEGKYEDATITTSFNDLEDVISWAVDQAWYQEPFVLIGHSLGGISVALFAQKYPKKIKGLAPISTVISGKLSLEVIPKKELEEWKKTGWQESNSISKPGIIKRLKWSHMEDRLKYNLLDNVEKLSMPVLLVVGELDTRTPLKHQEILFEKLPGKKELKVIKGSPHTFRDEKHLQELYETLDSWIKTL